MVATAKNQTKTPDTTSAARLKALYQSKIQGELADELKLANKYQAPKLEKIVVNVGLGRAKDDKKLIEAAEKTLRMVTGQQPVNTYAKKSIAGFKLREGTKIGLKVTLRDNRMYEFTDKLINLVLPRLRDFHGVSSKSFDASGNYSLGIEDKSVFPELTFDDSSVHGLQIVFVINSKAKEHSRALLEKLGMPFEKSQDKPFDKEVK